MLKCNKNNNNNNERLYESGLCVFGEKIHFNQQQQQQVHYKKSQKHIKPVVVKQQHHHHHPARRTERKTLHLNIVENFHGDDICGELLKTIRRSVEVEDFKRFLQAEAEIKKSDHLRRKYSNVYYEFFGRHYELLKSTRIRIE